MVQLRGHLKHFNIIGEIRDTCPEFPLVMHVVDAVAGLINHQSIISIIYLYQTNGPYQRRRKIDYEKISPVGD